MILDAFTYSIITIVAVLSFVVIFLARSGLLNRHDNDNKN
jgi:hypothetical protein